MRSLGSRAIAATIVTGVVAGFGASLFHLIADRFGHALFAWGDSTTAMTRLPMVLIIPTGGLFVIGLVLHSVPGARLGGVREVLVALDRDGGVVPLVRMLNVLLSALVLAFGGSVGPEGPMVQMGAWVGSFVGQRHRLAGPGLQSIVRAGAAAGSAAVFRSPAGAVLLTLEVFGARLNRELPLIAGAAAIGFLTRMAVLGETYPAPIPGLKPAPLAGLLLVAPLMGVIAAPAGHLFIRTYDRFQTVFPQRWPLPFRVAFGGLLVGTIAIWFPQVLSAGYPVINKSLDDGYPVFLFVALLLLKMLATSITFGSGAVGGLFAPTLVMGSLYGGAWGYGVHAIAPDLVPQPALFVLIGMVTMFGAIVKGYWSGLLLVADMSGCYHQLLIPGIIAGGASFLLSWTLHDRSVFGLPLEREPVAQAAAGNG